MYVLTTWLWNLGKSRNYQTQSNDADLHDCFMSPTATDKVISGDDI